MLCDIEVVVKRILHYFVAARQAISSQSRACCYVVTVDSIIKLIGAGTFSSLRQREETRTDSCAPLGFNRLYPARETVVRTPLCGYFPGLRP